MSEILDILGTKESQSIKKLLLELLGSALLDSKKTEEQSKPCSDGVCKSVPVSPNERIETRVFSKSDDESYRTSPDLTLGRPRYQWQKSLSSNDLQKDDKKKRETFSVFVGHLPRDITEGELADLFKDIGEVADAFVNPTTQNNAYTYGFVRFWELSEAKDAVHEKNNLMLEKRKISVELSADTRKKIADDDDEDDSKLLRKEYPKVIHNSSKENDDKMVMNKIKSSLIKLQEAKCWGGSSSEQIFSNIREVLKLLINYPMGLSEPSACEGRLQQVTPNDSSATNMPCVIAAQLGEGVCQKQDSHSTPLHSISMTSSDSKANHNSSEFSTIPVPSINSSDHLQSSSQTDISSSVENLDPSLMIEVQSPRESNSGDRSLTSGDLFNPKEDCEQSIRHSRYETKNQEISNGFMDGMQSYFSNISSQDTSDTSQRKAANDTSTPGSEHCSLPHNYHNQVVSNYDENKEMKNLRSSIIESNVPLLNHQSIDNSGVGDLKTEKTSNSVVIKRRKEQRSLAPSFANPSAETNVVRNGYQTANNSQLLDYKYSDLFSDLVIDDDAESINLKKKLDQIVKKSVELENTLIKKSRLNRKTVREVLRGNSTVSSQLEKQIHGAEIAFQKKKELLSSRIAEQELVYEKERLHATMNADFSVKIAKEMRKDRLRNETIIAELKYNILEMKTRLLKEQNEN